MRHISCSDGLSNMVEDQDIKEIRMVQMQQRKLGIKLSMLQ